MVAKVYPSNFRHFLQTHGISRKAVRVGAGLSRTTIYRLWKGILTFNYLSPVSERILSTVQTLMQQQHPGSPPVTFDDLFVKAPEDAPDEMEDLLSLLGG